MKNIKQNAAFILISTVSIALLYLLDWLNIGDTFMKITGTVILFGWLVVVNEVSDWIKGD